MNMKHSGTGEHKHDRGSRRSPVWKRLHRNWRLWGVVVLMLAAMMAYVLSDDESLQPGGGPPSEPMPAAAGP